VHLTSAESDLQQRRVAGSLQRLGLRRGERVVLLAPSTTTLVSTVLGALRSGVVPVPMDPRLTAHERAELLTDLQPALVLESVAGLLGGPEAELAAVPQARPMHLTSGTTGRPKGVWSGLLGDAAATALVQEERELWGFAAEDRHLVLSPLHHSAPLRFAMGTLLAGGEVAVPGPFEPAATLGAIERFRPTSTFCVPAHLQRLFAHIDEHRLSPDLSCFRLLAHAGAACPPATKRRAIEAFPTGTVWEFYGSTEGQFTACRAQEWQEREGTVGRARPRRRLIVDGDGLVWCVVPEHARFSYWADEAKTAAAWRETPDGPAFTVGDLGRLDAAGYLYLDGRRDDLVITGGVNVYPVEVENALTEHPDVDDVAVFGVPDDRWGHRVCAAVVGSATAEELDRFARQRLSPPKRPKDYVRVESLPRTASGKVQRPALVDLLGR